MVKIGIIMILTLEEDYEMDGSVRLKLDKIERFLLSLYPKNRQQ